MSIPSPRTLLGPLTTTWTPGPICSYGVATCDSCTTVWQGQTCNPSSKAHDFTDCWPPRSGSQASVDPGVMMGWGLYSPGIICPAGYTTAAMVSSGGPTGSWGVEYSFMPGETAMACCPPGFDISYITTMSTYGQTCVVTVTSTTFSTVQCDSGALTGFAVATVPRTASGGDVLNSYVIFAPLYQLNFQSSDLPPGGLPSATSSASMSGTTSSLAPGAGSTSSGSTVAETAASSSQSSSPSSSGGGGLSAGAKIGIGVGAGVVGLLILALLAALLWRAARRRRETSPSSAEGGDFDPDKKETEMTDRGVQELDGRPFVPELPTRLPSGRVPPQDAVRWRVSDQDWAVPPEGETDNIDGVPVTPTRPHGNRAFELEGDSVGSSRESMDPGGKVPHPLAQ